MDLVVRHGKVLVFVEVKSRSSQDHHRAFYAVGEAQKNRIKKSAQLWLRALEKARPRVRYDIIEVYLEEGKLPKCHWFKDAF